VHSIVPFVPSGLFAMQLLASKAAMAP